MYENVKQCIKNSDNYAKSLKVVKTR